MPQAPHDCTASTQSVSQIYITWINGDGYPQYDDIHIEKKKAGGSWAQYGAPVGPTATEALIGWLEDGTQYYARVHGHYHGDDTYTAYSNEPDAVTYLHDPDGMSGTCLSPTSIKAWWNDNAQNEANYILQRALGQSGSFSDYQTLGANVIEYIDTGLIIGMWYRYRVYAKNALTQSNYSNEVSVFTTDPPNAPSNLGGQATGKMTAHLTYQDNSSNETSFRIMIYPPGGPWSEWGYVGANVTEANITGLTQNTVYSFLVKARGDGGDSDYSNQISITTQADIAAPTNLTVAVLSGSMVFLRFQDNSQLEDDHRVEEKVGAGSFTEIATLPANVFGYRRTGLTAGQTLTYRVRAKQGAAYSNYSNEVTVTTMVVPGQVTNLVINGSGTEYLADSEMRLTWDVISGAVGYRVEKSTDGSAFTEIAKVDVNNYLAQGLSPSTQYWFKVRAYNAQGNGAYSSTQTQTTAASYTWSKIELALRNPRARLVYRCRVNPLMELSGFTLTEDSNVITNPGFDSDTSGWTVDQSSIASISGGQSGNCLEVTKVTGGNQSARQALGSVLVIGKTYKYSAYVKSGSSGNEAFALRIYDPSWNALLNITGTSSNTWVQYSGTFVATTTWVHVYLIKDTVTAGTMLFDTVALKKILATYQIAFGEDGAPIDAVYENGAAYAFKTSIADVEANASSYFWDYYAGLLYVHTSAGTNPVNFQILASFWLFFTSWKTKTDLADWGGNNYLSFLKQEEIPDITSEVTPYYEGSAASNFGSLSLVNAKIRGGHYFDKRYKKYIWRNRKVVFDVGLSSFSDSEFKPFFTGLISPEEGGVSCDDRRFRAELVDYRSGLAKTIPTHRFTTAEFPSIDASLIDKPVLRYYGTVTDVPAFLLDATNRIFLFNDGRVKQVDAVKKNDSTLTAGTDYTALQDIGQLILSKTLAWTSSDVITVNFIGCVNGADEPIVLGADIWKHILKTETNLLDAEFENDSIARTRITKTQTLKLLLNQDFNIDDVSRIIEQSNNAYVFQDGQGRLGLRPTETTAASNTPWVRNHHIFDYAQTAGPIFLGVNVYYDQNAKDPSVWKVETKTSNVNAWKCRAQKMLDIYTALTTQADAQALGTEIINLLEKDYVSMTASGLLLFRYGGDIILYSRDRAYNTAGTANQAVLRVYSVTKSIAAKKTSVRGELVS